ncbi:uncharacterized protein UMAG_00754 [Mycosarcoma maydis]|uniref:Uncharacterized protein n=1 Tax=Mycosarcoma maydis TaxID=5270 RepID=A0A0D1E916_MYCMD|nr:uncharacterized protein UMAG_00754 [Ustilago maydis 521]KIS72349.1 hypothetical protein UMAG_00754 [Ustilago maydis 521]|eukprot:XP_011386533.1 hypothetical protein UMAG_00754 [Ustilago maydis 521]
MRRSASPSKVNRSATPVQASVRSDSSSVLKTPFKPLSGLEGHRNLIASKPTSNQKIAPISSVAASSTSTSTAARELRTRSTTELQEEVADMQMILSEKLIAHNASRAEAGLAEQQPEQIVAEYIRLLTEYNSVKDAVQVIFDKIAEIEQLPSKDIHARYGVGNEAK